MRKIELEDLNTLFFKEEKDYKTKVIELLLNGNSEDMFAFGPRDGIKFIEYKENRGFGVYKFRLITKLLKDKLKEDGWNYYIVLKEYKPIIRKRIPRLLQDEMRCPTCNEIKPASQFYINKEGMSQYKCKECNKIASREYYHSNKGTVRERRKKYQLEYYQKNKEKILAKRKVA